MKIAKAFGMSLLAVSMSALPVLAQASLTIVNNTDKDATSIINGKKCSTEIPGGVTHPHSTNVIGDIVVGFACLGHPSDCKADVYMTSNCNQSGGTSIGTVTFDVKKGITYISGDTSDQNKFVISGSGFNVQIDYKS